MRKFEIRIKWNQMARGDNEVKINLLKILKNSN